MSTREISLQEGRFNVERYFSLLELTPTNQKTIPLYNKPSKPRIRFTHHEIELQFQASKKGYIEENEDE